jgi:hypothetical protein
MNEKKKESRAISSEFSPPRNEQSTALVNGGVCEQKGTKLKAANNF